MAVNCDKLKHIRRYEMKDYKLEIFPAYEQFPGTRVLSGAVVFSCVFRSCSECGLILYNLKDNGSVRIPFSDEYRFGDLYSVRIAGLSPKEWGYRYYRDGISFVDPGAKKLIILSDATAAGGFFLDREETFIPSPVADKAVDFSSEWIYVCHVKGLTASSRSGVRKKGTFAGLAEKIPYLKAVGVKAVELMPAYESAPVNGYSYPDSSKTDEQADNPAASPKAAGNLKTNFWNFGDGCYYSPKNDYAYSDDASTEFKEMVGKLHEADIRVYLMMHFPDTVSAQMQHEVVKFYVTHYQIDGFHIIGSASAIRTIAEDPLLSRTAIFHNGFAYNDILKTPGSSPFFGKPSLSNLCEHNASYRRLIRSYVKGDPQSMPAFLRAFTSVPTGHGRVIYATNYDGFTLYDLVTYNFKHNEENGEDNRDGENINLSWNCGIEGESRKKEIRSLRQRQMRNFLALLFLSQGTPLIFSGDEFGNTQNGNNNPYCQDNETGWVSWKKNKESEALTGFFRELTAFRDAHPVFSSKKDFSKNAAMLKDKLPEFSLHGKEAWKPDLDGNSLCAGVLYAVDGDILYIGMNMFWRRAELGLPKLPEGYSWYVCMNTFEDEPFAKAPVCLEEQHHLMVRERSVCVLLGRKDSDGPGTV